MPEAQIAQLTDEKLCELSKGYDFEPKLEAEIGRRDLECTDEYLSCKRQGYQPRTPAFENCKNYENLQDMAGKAIKDAMRGRY